MSSGNSPARSLRTKTSEFLRGGSRHNHSSQNLDTEIPPMPLHPDEAKTKRSRIPFLGGRHKPESSSVVASAPRTLMSRKSRDVKRDTKMARSASRQVIETNNPPLVASSSSSQANSLPPLNVSPPSLSSKFAAHFHPGRLRSPHASSLVSLSPPASTMSDPLPRMPSVDSSRPSGDTRSSTPRQPAISVSRPSEEAQSDQFHDLFVVPRSPQSPETLAPDTDSLSMSPTPPTSPRMEFPVPPRSESLNLSQSRVRRTQSVKGPPRQSPLQAKHQPSPEPRASIDSDETYKSGPSKAEPSGSTGSSEGRRVSQVLTGRPLGDSDSAEEDKRPTLVHRSSAKSSLEKMPTATTTLAKASGMRKPAPLYKTSDLSVRSQSQPQSPKLPPTRSPSIRSVRSIRSTASSPVSLSPSAPPTTPLPAPPPASTPKTAEPIAALPSIPSLASVVTHNVPENKAQPRTRTMTLPSAPTRIISPTRATFAAGSPPGSPRISMPKRLRASVSERVPANESDKENGTTTPEPAAMTREQLQEALTVERARYDFLAQQLLTMKERYEAEKCTLEKKVCALERDAVRRDREIKGLRWLVMNGTGSLMDNPGERMSNASEITSSTASSDLEQYALSLNALGRGRAGYSTTSVSESDGDNAGKDHAPPGEQLSPSASPTRTSFHAGLGLELDLPEATPGRKSIAGSSRSSMASSNSSTSSLPLPSLTAGPTAASGLDVILESPTPETSGAAAQQLEKDERRASRALKRLSAGSAGTSSSAAYGANLAQARSPTIAQILDQPVSMDDVLEKLKPFAGSSSHQP